MDHRAAMACPKKKREEEDTQPFKKPAFSPDGKFMAVGAPSGRDSMYVYQMVPEPGTIALFVLCGLGILFLKRRG